MLLIKTFIVVVIILFISLFIVLWLVRYNHYHEQDKAEARVYSMLPLYNYTPIETPTTLSSLCDVLPLYNHTPAGTPTNLSSLCDVLPCVEVLSQTDKQLYRACTNSAQERFGSVVPSMCGFIPGSDRAPVPLASFPGSGNTWIRGLLEKATGICTGATQCDPDLRSKGFAGDGLTSGSVLVVKTHYFSPVTSRKDIPPTTKVVVIMRNPYDTLVAERNRAVTMSKSVKNCSHIQLIGVKYFRKEATLTIDKMHVRSGRDWDNFVISHSNWWKEIVKYWVVSRHIPPLVIKYEDIMTDAAAGIAKILTYLDMERNIDDIRASLKDGYNMYKRTRHNNFTHFTDTHVIQINKAIREAQQLLDNDVAKHYQVDLKSYLRL